MVYAGASKAQIAKALDVHRNTVTNWTNAPEFADALAALQTDRVGAVRVRRAQQTNSFTDRIAKLADRSLASIEKAVDRNEPISVIQRTELREYLGEFRAMRNEERIDNGDNMQKHQHQVSGAVQHHHVHSVRNKAFKDYLQEQINGNVIDLGALEESQEQPVVALVERLLTDSNVLDTFAEEDRAQQFEATNERR